MIQNLNGKNTKDTESPADTMLFDTGAHAGMPGRIGNKTTISGQSSNVGNFDNSIEKRSRI